MESEGTTEKTGSSEVSEVSKQRENDDAEKPTEDVGNEVSKEEENGDSEKPAEDVSNDDSNKDDPENQKESREDGTEPIESEDDYRLQPMFVCCCGASFQFLGQITSHKKKNCDWIYVCPHCDRVYKDFVKLNEHKKTHPLPPWPVIHAPVEPATVPALATEEKEKNVKVEESDSKNKEEEKKETPSEEVKSEGGTKPDDKKDINDDTKQNLDTLVKKIEQATAQTKPKLQIKPVEKKIPPHFRSGVFPIQSPGNFMGNQMRPNIMQNRGMMNPQQNFMGGFNQGMNYGMGMQPMMNAGMGGYGPMNAGMNMGNFGGFNMPNQFCGPNMGMMGMNMGGPNMGGMNNMGMNMSGMNMGGMNMGMNMGGMNTAPNMGLMNNTPNMGLMNNPPNLGGINSTPNMGLMNNAPHMGGRNNAPNIGGMNIGNAVMSQGGFNTTPGGNMPLPLGNKDQSVNRALSRDVGRDLKIDPSIRERALSRDVGRDLKIDPPIRERSLSPPPRRGEETRSSLGLSPPRRGLDKDRDSYREREYRDRFDYRDEDPIDRLGSSERSRWKDDSRDRYSPSDRDRSDRGWSKRSMTREEFLSISNSGFFSKASPGSSAFPKSDNPFDRNYSSRDDGPPGLGKIGFSGVAKRDNPDPIIMSRAAKILRSSEYR